MELRTKIKPKNEAKYGFVLVVLYLAIFLSLGSFMIFVPTAAKFKLTFQFMAYFLSGFITGYFLRYIDSKQIWNYVILIAILPVFYFYNGVKTTGYVFTLSVVIGFVLAFILGKIVGRLIVEKQLNKSKPFLALLIVLVLVSLCIKTVQFSQPSSTIIESKNKGMLIWKYRPDSKDLSFRDLNIHFADCWLEGVTGVEFSFFTYRKLYIMRPYLFCFTLKNDYKDIDTKDISFLMVYSSNHKSGLSRVRNGRRVYYYQVDRLKENYLISVETNEEVKEVKFQK